VAGGIVYLVGAGPGDPGLMTRRSLELIASADAILYDRLIPADALAGARADADLRYVGKAPGDVPVTQEDTNALLVELGLAGKRVVRLKGGDPFVFGRGGEEAEALVAAGVPFEIVPGVTAGVAAPAYAGIPVTHRDDASAVAFVTGHEDPEKAETALDWEALAAFPHENRVIDADAEHEHQREHHPRLVAALPQRRVDELRFLGFDDVADIDEFVGPCVQGEKREIAIFHDVRNDTARDRRHFLLAQRREPSVHFSADAARVPACGGLARPHRVLGEKLGERLHDRERLPHGVA